MTFVQPTKVTELTQELRLATTMTGGVSLAIWMGGVAREINLLSQASQWRRTGGEFPAGTSLSTPATESLKLYAGLIDLLDLVVDVDVLSGTSAGGINAALLASARATGIDLGGFRDLWMDLGALTDLLRNPADKTTPSLLYGDERMFAALEENLPKLAIGPFPPVRHEDPAWTPPTTLYVTTTLLTGEVGRFTDSFGTVVQDVDRRGLFTFTRSQLAEREGIAPALALAARSSASFPGAFEPSFIPFNRGTAKTKTIPARPGMAAYANTTRPHWVADGGLLDNRPIGVLLQSIFDRPARRPVRRVLLFVVPSSGPAPDLLEQAPPDDVSDPLGLVDGLLQDLAAVTTQSIAADLKAIRAHQDRLEARTDTRLRLAELAPALRDGSRLLTVPLLDDYRTRQATKEARDLTAGLLKQLSTWPDDAPSSNSLAYIPSNWQQDLRRGGDTEEICRLRITQVILERWSPPSSGLPETSADLAKFGQAAHTFAKVGALAVVRAAYQLATTDAEMAELARLTQAIHAARPPVPPVDVPDLVRQVCTDPAVRQLPFDEAVATLATSYLDQRATEPDAWTYLGSALDDEARAALQALADATIEAAKAGPLRRGRLEAAEQLAAYLAYLSPAADAEGVARLLFDLAVTQRAMQPVEADVEQNFQLVQVSADTRTLLAPGCDTAQKKLTGMQFHHFGAFYKRSWRANDWMWGRLDGAGWLVHVLLDPRRVLWVADRHRGAETGVAWFLGRLKDLGAPDFPAGGYPLSDARDAAGNTLTLAKVEAELAFLDDPALPLPISLPMTSMWLSQTWQHRVVDDELEGLARAVYDPNSATRPDWSPTVSRTWADKVLTASPEAKYALLREAPVARETFVTDKASPLMARTITKAAATASGAVGSAKQVPGVLKPAVTTLRTLTLGAYRAVSLTKGVTKRMLALGIGLLVLGVALAIQSATLAGVTGLVMAGVGAILVVLGTWQLSGKLLGALLSVTLIGAVLALGTPVVRDWLVGTAEDPGLLAENIYWLGATWWHPFVVIGAIALVVAVVAAATNGSRSTRRS